MSPIYCISVSPEIVDRYSHANKKVYTEQYPASTRPMNHENAITSYHGSGAVRFRS